MNRFISAAPVILVLSASSVVALADDAPAATPAATKVATQATSTATQAPPARVTSASTSSSDPAVQRFVCLNMSLQCFAVKPKQDDSAAKARTASLDLKAPDIRRLVPETDLREPLQEPEIEEQQVQVEGTRPEVYVPGGIASLPWAVMHPTQAWRIFLPVPPGTAK